MKTKQRLSFIDEELTKLYPTTECFLHYTKDYELLLAVLLSAQTTDIAVNKVTKVLFSAYPTLEDFSKADIDDIKSIISSIGLMNNKAKAIIETSKILHEKYHDQLPRSIDELMELPGVGFKTASVVLAELYDFPLIPVDTHIFRIINRLRVFEDNMFSADSMSKELNRNYGGASSIGFHRKLILFGRNICTAKNPKCDLCPFRTSVLKCIVEKGGL